MISDVEAWASKRDRPFDLNSGEFFIDYTNLNCERNNRKLIQTLMMSGPVREGRYTKRGTRVKDERRHLRRVVTEVEA